MQKENDNCKPEENDLDRKKLKKEAATNSVVKTATGMRVNKKRVFSQALSGEQPDAFLESEEDSEDKEMGQCGLRNISE